MNRTYHYQVDNGLFVAGYYLNKEIEDITVDDLSNNVDFFTNKLWNLVEEKGFYKSLSHTTHINSQLNQKTRTKEALSSQLEGFLDNIGNDKTCILCGEKRVNISFTENTHRSFISGIVAKTFFNSSNNLQTVDICPVCMFLSMISFLNTQKMSYPFLYLSDSNEFMNYITEEIQNSVNKNILLDFKESDLERNFLELCTEKIRMETIFDLNYIELIFFQNGKDIYYKNYNVEKDKIIFFINIKNKGLIKEFCDMKLFNSVRDNKLLINRLLDSNNDLKCSKELFKEVEEWELNSKDIEIIDRITKILYENYSIEDIKKTLKLCDNNKKFEDFIIKHSENIPLYKTLEEFEKITNYKNWLKFKKYIIAKLILINNI